MIKFVASIVAIVAIDMIVGLLKLAVNLVSDLIKHLSLGVKDHIELVVNSVRDVLLIIGSLFNDIHGLIGISLLFLLRDIAIYILLALNFGKERGFLYLHLLDIGKGALEHVLHLLNFFVIFIVKSIIIVWTEHSFRGVGLGESLGLVMVLVVFFLLLRVNRVLVLSAFLRVDNRAEDFLRELLLGWLLLVIVTFVGVVLVGFSGEGVGMVSHLSKLTRLLFF